MLKSCAIMAAVLATGLTLSACAASPAEAVRSADAAKAQCRIASQPGGDAEDTQYCKRVYQPRLTPWPGTYARGNGPID